MKFFKKHIDIDSTSLAAQAGEGTVSTAELIRKVKALEIKSKIITNRLFTGEYHSAFKGKGMHFREVREYSAGDDIRFIDWNVSARFSHPFSKLFEEERELTMMLIIDISSSNLIGTQGKRKRDLISEIAAVLAFSAITNNDKVGAILFDEKVRKFIPPAKGRAHGLFIVRELISAPLNQSTTHLDAAIKFFNNTTRQKSIAFIISDFLSQNFESDLRIIGKRHDVTGIKIYDAIDRQLPDAGMLQVCDAETGEIHLIDSSNPVIRQIYHQEFNRKTQACNKFFRTAGAELLHMSTDEDYIKILQKFFLHRK